MIKSFFLNKKWALWAWGGFAFIIGSLLAQTYIDVKINHEWRSLGESNPSLQDENQLS